jgi:azurin
MQIELGNKSHVIKNIEETEFKRIKNLEQKHAIKINQLKEEISRHIMQYEDVRMIAHVNFIGSNNNKSRATDLTM